ncbi:hypothetical protein FBF35_09840 [Schaalia odontolytica]|uniref:Uncharacterized protein n=1 Tax=Schaalia odontolytica TaxID=1660 RepID=A0A0V8RYN1_9ACTO|nr:hypothetical protein [Schaalia odontolytica]KSW13168.1 hypothetical protein APY09_02080 [Schaalia odontolytica]QCT36282.1 hypothetical protein FBF35_09840 [Schaalia odontolytica]
MVSSPMYDRLMKFVEGVEESRKLSGYDTEHSAIIAGMGMMSSRVSHFKEYQGFEGQTGEAIDGWIDRAQQRYSSERQGYVTGTEHYVEGRRLLVHAAEDAKLLSPTLLDKATEAMRGLAQVVIPVTKHMGPFGETINTIATTGAAYVDAIEAQANAQREAAATAILQRVNDEAQKLADQLQAHTEQLKDLKDGIDDRSFPSHSGPSSPSVSDQLNQGNMWVSPHEAGVYGASRDDDYGRSDLRGQGSGLYADGYDEGGPIDSRVMSSKRIPNQYISEGELGSRLNPVTDPQDLMDIDLLHTRVNGDRHANGVIGGHTPASPVDRDHPLWRFNGGPASESSTAGRLGGAGILGAGALGLRGSARMGSAGTSMGRAGGAGAGSAAGSTALRTGSYSGAGFGKYTPPAPAGATGAGANGTSGVTGLSGTSSGANSAGSSAAGGRTQGAGGFMGAGGAGAGGKKDEKKVQRRRYTPFRFEEDDELPEGYVNPLSQTYGSDKDISPAPRKDDGWDPRQW